VGYALLRDKESEFKYKMRLLDYLEENPHQIKENPLRYSSALNNILLYYYFQGYSKEYPVYLKKLDGIELKFHHAKSIFFDTKYNLEIGYYLHLRDEDKVRGALVNMEKWYSSLSSAKGVQAKMICEYNMALANFYLKENRDALKWCNSCFSLFDMKAKKFRHDLAVSALMIEVLIYLKLTHFELAERNMELIISIAKKNKYLKLEMTILKLIKKVIFAETKDSYISEIREIVSSNDVVFSNLDEDVLVVWLESLEK